MVLQDGLRRAGFSEQLFLALKREPPLVVILVSLRQP